MFSFPEPFLISNPNCNTFTNLKVIFEASKKIQKESKIDIIDQIKNKNQVRILLQMGCTSNKTQKMGEQITKYLAQNSQEVSAHTTIQLAPEKKNYQWSPQPPIDYRAQFVNNSQESISNINVSLEGHFKGIQNISRFQISSICIPNFNPEDVQSSSCDENQQQSINIWSSDQKHLKNNLNQQIIRESQKMNVIEEESEGENENTQKMNNLQTKKMVQYFNQIDKLK